MMYNKEDVGQGATRRVVRFVTTEELSNINSKWKTQIIVVYIQNVSLQMCYKKLNLPSYPAV
jgi:hypothetical protein